MECAGVGVCNGSELGVPARLVHWCWRELCGMCLSCISQGVSSVSPLDAMGGQVRGGKCGMGIRGVRLHGRSPREEASAKSLLDMESPPARVPQGSIAAGNESVVSTAALSLLEYYISVTGIAYRGHGAG
jgi:hypothetical protein